MDAYVRAGTSCFTHHELLKIREEAQLPCGPLYITHEISEDPRYKAGGNILMVQDPRLGELAIPDLALRLSETPGEVRWLGPAKGEHDQEVHRDWLKLSGAEMAVLAAARVI